MLALSSGIDDSQRPDSVRALSQFELWLRVEVVPRIDSELFDCLRARALNDVRILDLQRKIDRLQWEANAKAEVVSDLMALIQWAGIRNSQRLATPGRDEMT